MTTEIATATTAAAGASPGLFRRNRGKIILVGFLAVVFGAGALWTLVTLTFSYSDGDRIGFVQKLSRKGWLCRTWEGELAMTPVPGSAPQMFMFTVPDEDVVKLIQAAEGKKVALHYQEKRGVPSSCFGDTSYFVTAVRALGP
jgi:hypothetical protein